MSPDYKLVAVDLDGTLLSSAHEIANADREALHATLRAGIAVAIVTGRRLPSARRYVAALGFEAFVVVNSGAIIKRGLEGPLLHRQLLPRTVGEEVIAIAIATGVEPIVHDGPDGEGHLILRDRAGTHRQLERYLQTDPPPVRVSSLTLERDPVQIGFAASVSMIRALASRLATELSSKTDVTLARTEYPDEDLALLDVLSSSASKAESLKFLGKHLEISTSEMVAIGDNWNDVDMLETAGLGVLMQNASQEMRRSGFVTTKTNDEAGVAHAIDQYVLRPPQKRKK